MNRKSGTAAQVASAALPVVESLEERALFNVFTVTSPAPGGPGSLRMQINQANSNPGLDTINFSIGVGPQTITPGNLPFIVDPVIIDATSQPGFTGQPIIQLS